MSAPLTGILFEYEARILSLLGPVDHSQINLAIDQLLRCDADSDKDITVFISCQGGNLIEALKLVDTVGLLRSQLTAIGFGLIEGAAVPMLASAHQRILMASTLVSTAGLWELPHLHPEARPGIGLHPQSSSMGEQLRARLLDQIKTSERSWGKVLDPNAASRLFTASQCLELGLADAVVEGPNRLLQRLKRKERHHEYIRLSH
jgi:ATP-dependent protease ClpP protease subunit